MSNVLVRDLDEKALERLKVRAKANGRSLQAEMKGILEDAAQLSMEDARKAAARIRKRLASRPFSDSAKLIAKDRRR